MKVYCQRTDCKYCSKKKSSAYSIGNEPLYKCKRTFLAIVPPFDFGGDIEAVAGKQAICRTYDSEIFNEQQEINK